MKEDSKNVYTVDTIHTKFDEELFKRLQEESEMDPNTHDGSYELVQETVKAYKDVSPENLNYLDLNCVYLMTVGTWKHNFEKKEETINKSHLTAEDKKHLISLLRKIQQNAEDNKYENRERGNPTCGMFGTGFYSFQDKTNDNSVRQFIKLCLDIVSENDEEKIFGITEEALKTKINGMQTGSISQILHCLKPFVFPILNRYMKQETVFAKLCIDIKDQNDSTQYIPNCRKIKEFRDNNFSFKNYRIMDRFEVPHIRLNKLDEYKYPTDYYRMQMNDANGKRIAEKMIDKGLITASIDYAREGFEKLQKGDVILVHKGSFPIALVAIIEKQKELDEFTFGIDYSVDVLIDYRKEITDYKNVPRSGTFFAVLDNKTEVYKFIDKEYLSIVGDYKMDYYKELLKENKNIILHGAPGTGKTYLAKEIAKTMDNAEVGFCQFHPSYDYTDFVEGLRPSKNGSFERIDGVFKKFCADAVENINDYNNAVTAETNRVINTQDLINQYGLFLERKLMESDDKLIPFSNSMKIRDVLRSSNGDVRSVVIATSLEAETRQNLTAQVFNRDYQAFKDGLIKSYQDIKPLKESTSSFHGNADYLFVLYGMIKDFEESDEYIKPVNNTTNKTKTPKNFVFIIDEINRGELSKIFGELFFSIDPGYRGLDKNGKQKGLVQTQYQNLVDEDDVFADGFFIPENVYIIGTMNDIDRSVESMDFAMRRRFIFKEVTAGESADSMQLPQDVKDRMKRINDVIASIEGLGKDYQIGGAYFLNVTDFDKLWKLRLSSLVKEYLRGMDEDGSKFKTIENAYFDKPENAGDSSNTTDSQDSGN